MKVILYPSDKSGCGFYRCIWPGLALKEKGYDVEVSFNRPQLLNHGDKVVGLAQNIDADVVVFQRPARPAYLAAFRYFQSIGMKVVVDMDDLLSEIHPLNVAFTPYQQRDMHWKYAIEACEMADLVTVTTPALAEHYGKNGNAVVIPNYLPNHFFDVDKPVNDNGIVTVGWAAHIGTHPRDPDITHGAVNQALSETKGRSRFWACDEKSFFNFGIKQRDPHLLVEGVPLPEYPSLLSQLDVGLVPLAPSNFNEAKSWLKGLEYAACGVAPVVSPTPDNMRLVEAGAALPASNPRDWKDNVKILITDDSERESLIKRSKEFASTQTIERNCNQWWEAWSSLI